MRVALEAWSALIDAAADRAAVELAKENDR
jgi:hypothetical protein